MSIPLSSSQSCKTNLKHPRFVDAIEAHEVVVPATVLVEASILAMIRGLDDHLVELIGSIEGLVIPVDETIMYAAIDAFRRYGKGRHKANLKFRDCFVYATAKTFELPLIYKGDDFTHTDLALADSAKPFRIDKSAPLLTGAPGQFLVSISHL